MQNIKKKSEMDFRKKIKPLLDSGSSAADIIQYLMEAIIDDLHPHFEIVSDETFDLRESVYKRIFRQTETNHHYEISWNIVNDGSSTKIVFKPAKPIYN